MTMREVGEETWRGAREAGTALERRAQGAVTRARELVDADAEQLAQGLGWFSVGLGLAELALPEGVARFIGVPDDDDNCALLRACGLRELASGVGILTTPEPRGLLWGRVAGDVMDLCLLGAAASVPSNRRERLALAGAAVLGVTALDLLAARGLTAQARGDGREWRDGRQRRAQLTSGGAERLGQRRAGARAAQGIHVRKSITVRRSPEEVYRFWRQLENLPTFMSHLESVTTLDSARSRWKAKAPLGMSVEWEAEITSDQPAERLAWRSLSGADVEHAGQVRFVAAPGGRGTELHVELRYQPPAGKVGAVFAKLFGEAPEQQIAGDLRRFKQVLETGEVVHSDASVARTPHHARPPTTGAATTVSHTLGEGGRP